MGHTVTPAALKESERMEKRRQTREGLNRPMYCYLVNVLIGDYNGYYRTTGFREAVCKPAGSVVGEERRESC